ncbi:type I restriction-modification system methyltransferase subunit [Beggiatoa alba B18LD]|uniref:Type I restriction-modification system methyltransferase subunit n=1 Tax=Beggiatoa alba B18LD TaxID=395493 RepID=I3CEN9_9GAMM|nr:N-6 DNA methylase [Beggiatoa alba]EIJ42082.1 type I restriction-modification system methyltransferase subunit [Beggiatoa alba B18LD]
MKIQQILKDSNYKLAQFKQSQIEALENQVIEKESKGKTTYKITCAIRNKEINLTPEEIVRQLYLQVLMQDYAYPANRIQLEYAVSFGIEKKRADIVIMDKDRPDTAYIIVELKKPKLKEGKEQLKSYCNATGAPMGVWTNGKSISYYHRKDPNYFEDIPHIPRASERLTDVLSERWTIADLVKHDKLINEKKSLKDLILEMEDEVLANAGVDVFEEMFKLIFTKLYDEMEGGRDKARHLVFKNYGETETELKTKMQALFDKAREKWEGVFSADAKLQLTPSHLAVCVASLEKVKLFNSNLDVVDEAFEYLINKTSKGEKGQYFTPRYVIDMCVKMLNPQEDETMIDTAAGSCGFPVHAIFHVWKQILVELNIPVSHLFTLEKKPPRCEDYVREKVFAIDFDEKAVRVGRTLNLIAGDGQTNVLHLNTLDFERWDEKTKDDEWRDIYGDGWKRLRKLQVDKSHQRFNLDVLMANPPFAGDIKETRMLAKYELSLKADGKRQTALGRDILFIERNLDFLKAGGRMAVVLPQGRFNNSSDKLIREFIAERCRILAVVGLHGNVFKPHTGTKTSVLFLQKWTDDKGICPKREDYPIFFATMQKPSKDNSGDKIYVKQANGEPVLDEHGHLIVEHDLFNHEGLAQDGIAEAFVEFAKKEKLSFFDSSSFNEVKYRTLLEGLEVSEVMFSETLKNKDFRIDSDFHTKIFKINPNLKYTAIGNILLISQYGISIEMNENGIGYPIYRMNEIHNMLCDLDVDKYADISFDDFQKFKLNNGDVLFNRTNSYEWVGRTGIFYEQDHKDFIFASYLVRFVPDKNIILPEYLTTFLNTKFGILDVKRRARHSINQTNVNPEEVKEIQIPLLNISFQEILQKLFREAHNKRCVSQAIYATAENLLLETLGLKDFQPTSQNINIKSFKDSFLNSGRLDAEYYQPKYEELEAKLDIFAKVKIIDLVNHPVSSGSTPKAGGDAYIEDSKNGIPFIRAVDLINSRVSIDNFIYVKEEIHNSILKKTQLKENDVLFSIAGTVGRCAIFDYSFKANINQAVCILRFNENILLRLYVIAFFNSSIGKMYIEKYARQGLQTNLNLQEVSNLDIPILSIETQTQIATQIQTSFTLRQQSEKLLELAKRAVEIAIEQDEQSAMAFLDNF